MNALAHDGRYGAATRGQVHATLKILRRLRFVARQFPRSREVYRIYGEPLEGREAPRHLNFWIHCAIARRGKLYGADGYSPDNHLGRPQRKWSDDYQRALCQDAADVAFAARRGRVYQFRTDLVRRRLGHLLVAAGE